MVRVTKADVITSNGKDQCNGLNVCGPQQNSYVESLTLHAMALGGGGLWGLTSSWGQSLMNELTLWMD